MLSSLTSLLKPLQIETYRHIKWNYVKHNFELGFQIDGIGPCVGCLPLVLWFTFFKMRF